MGILQEITERFHEREGHYLERIHADSIYQNKDNLAYCKQCHIRAFGPTLAGQRNVADRRQVHQDECTRKEVECCFSFTKRKCSMGLVTARLQETATHVSTMSIVVLNTLPCELRNRASLGWPFGFYLDMKWRCDIGNQRLKSLSDMEEKCKKADKQY